MFEKEAEEYAKKVYGNSTEMDYYGIADAFKDGAEFGYNKAKEESKWHDLRKDSNSLFSNVKKYRQFISFDELITEFNKRFGFEVKTQSYAFPLIWVKRKGKYEEIHLITGYVFSEQDGQLVKIGNVYYGLGELFEHYEFLDDSPCGVEE